MPDCPARLVTFPAPRGRCAKVRGNDTEKRRCQLHYYPSRLPAHTQAGSCATLVLHYRWRAIARSFMRSFNGGHNKEATPNSELA
jgi:hypothetical protein